MKNRNYERHYVKLNKEDSRLQHYLNKGYSTDEAISIAIEKFGWYLPADSLVIVDFKNCYHVYGGDDVPERFYR